MSKIKLPHASGNSMSIAAPATNPASDLELKLPATVGTANQVIANGSTPGTLEFTSAGKILNVSSMTLTSDGNNHINNQTGDAGAETTIVRKSASSNFIIYIATNVYRSSNNGIGTLGYKRAINSGSYSADQQMLRATDADRSVMAIRSYIDTTTGSVGDTVKITARYANDQSQNDNVRSTQTMIMEFEP